MPQEREEQVTTTQAPRRRPARRVPLDPAKLTRARERAGMSMSELARRAGMAASHVDGIERGYHGAGPAYALRLAAQLGVRLEDLLADEEAEPRTGTMG